MIREHSTGNVTAFGHDKYQPYDAIEGKLATFARNSKGYLCASCERRFFTEEQRDNHRCRGGEE